MLLVGFDIKPFLKKTKVLIPHHYSINVVYNDYECGCLRIVSVGLFVYLLQQ